MNTLNPREISVLLPYSLGHAIEIAWDYSTQLQVDTKRLLEILESYRDALFKSKVTDSGLHEQTRIGAKAVMESKLRDGFRSYIVSIGDTSSADFLTSMYNYLQNARHGYMKYDLFEDVLDKALAVGTDLKEELAEINREHADLMADLDSYVE